MDTEAPAQPSDRQPWHALETAEAARAIQSDAALGLSTNTARERLARFGENALPEPKRRSLVSVFIGQFKSPLIYLLLVAAGIALTLGHASDAVVIAVVVLLNAVIGSLQEGRAERALAALRKLATHSARVLRDGKDQVIEARGVVPGDVVLVEAGDIVCADARLLDGAALQIAEAALTGESVPVSKQPGALAAETPLAERNNMIYAGTHVTAGRARGLVVATGLGTEVGRIAALAEQAVEDKTPLEARVASLGKFVIVAASLAFLSVVLIGTWRGIPLGEAFMVGISLLVGVIPEGLPVAMTIALAVGVQRMAKRKAVVRRLSAVETLGSTTVICTDKTGTLTRNEMTVTAIHLSGGRELSVTGAGFEPLGEFFQQTPSGRRSVDPASDSALRELLEAGVLCNDALLAGPHDEPPTWTTVGDPTEVALVVVAIKAGLLPESLRSRYPRRVELPFDPTAKLMATQHVVDGRSRVVIKGAPEAVLALCGTRRRGTGTEVLDERGLAEIAEVSQRMAESALRVLAVAVVDDAEVDGRASYSAFRGRATFLGVLGQMDPPRAEVKDAVERCWAAGIRPVMVTGDHKATGYAIAKELGIARPGDLVVDGNELEAMSNQELEERARRISVFARVHPAQKLRIVEAYQKNGEVVAMTGDGVNDAPALAKADVGLAMGVTGTEVAKEAAKIVVGDDNFATIIAAVEEGRVTYQNIKKTLLLLFSTSAAEVLVLLLAMLAGYPPPFAALQILWINLVTESAITVNLVMDPAEGNEMRHSPIPRSEPLLTRRFLTRMALMVPAIVVSTLGWFVVRNAQGISEAQVRTETFTLLAICAWFNVLSCRSAHRSAFTFDLFRNKWLIGGLVLGNLLQIAVVFWSPLGQVFHTVPISFREVVLLGIVGSLVLWVEELRKLVARRRMRAPDQGPQQRNPKPTQRYEPRKLGA